MHGVIDKRFEIDPTGSCPLFLRHPAWSGDAPVADIGVGIGSTRRADPMAADPMGSVR